MKIVFFLGGTVSIFQAFLNDKVVCHGFLWRFTKLECLQKWRWMDL